MPAPARVALGAAALVAAVLLGPGLLSGERPEPAASPSPSASPASSPAATRAVTPWTGASTRPDGNVFVESPARLLRLPRSS